MAKSKENKDLCRMITPEFRVSYPHVFKAQAPNKGDKLKYSITMLFPKDSDLTGSTVDGKPVSIKKIILNAKIAAYGADKEKWPDVIESPVVDGDDPKFADKEGYKGHWVIKASTNEDSRPGVVDATMKPITNPNDLYPGCYARAYVYATAWNFMKKDGIMFILDHVQKLRDGKSFGGKKPVEQVFTPVNDVESEDFSDEEEADFR